MEQFLTWFLKYRAMGPFIGLIALVVLFESLSQHKTFLTLPQLSTIAALSSSVGMIALGVTLLMIGGEFDLSVSETFVLAPIVMSLMISEQSCTPGVAFLAAIAIVSLVGVVNGALTILAGIPSFISTLGMLFVIRSVNRTLAGGMPVELVGVEGWTITLMGGEVTNTPLSAPLVWMLVVGGFMWLILEFTRHGNATRAVGHEGGAVARAMGVSVVTTKMINFVSCAALAGAAGCLRLANFGVSSVNDGRDYNLMAIVAAVIGGTSLFGVRGTVIGTILGAILLGTLKSGLVFVGTAGEYYAGMIGILLLAAAVINRWTEALRERGGR